MREFAPLLKWLLIVQAVFYVIEDLLLTIYQFTHRYPVPLSDVYYTERAAIFFIALVVIALLILYCAIATASAPRTRLLVYIEAISLIVWVFITITGGGDWAELSLLVACLGMAAAIVRSKLTHY